MKKILLSLLLFTMIIGCKHDTTDLRSNTDGNETAIGEAKRWYEESYKKVSEVKSTKNQDFDYSEPKDAEPGNPIWEKAKIETIKQGITLISMPYDTSGKKFHFSKFGFKRLLIYKYETGDRQAFWVEVNSDVPVDKDNFSISSFTGRILIFDANDHFLTGTKYELGKKKAEIILGNKSDIKSIINSIQFNHRNLLKGLSSKNQSIKVVNGGGLICYDIYSRNCLSDIGWCSEWMYESTECDMVESPGTGGTGGSSGGGSGGGSGGSGTGTGDHEPGSGGAVGVNTIGYYFPDNLFNGKDGNKPLGEYPSACDGAQALWNASVNSNKETVGVITADGQFIYVAQVEDSGGSWGGLYTYQNQAYYTYPDKLGSPGRAYSGMLHSAGQYFIPIKATVHTHSPCIQDGTDGISNMDLSAGDRQLAAKYKNINHYIIGCGSVGKFSSDSGSPSVIASGELSTTCSNFK